MAVPPPDPWHRRYYGYTNRPFSGCGCLYLLILLVLIWLFFSWLFAVPWAYRY
ncbi:MAG: hypothetical protein IT305_07150 [Chloroflexi bacterium]|nr:hypothetical protein [Chloroflexota bacterium]